MTYEEYQKQKATLESALASLDQQYMAEHGLAIGTRVRYQGQIGYVEDVEIYSWDGSVKHHVRAAKKDGTMANGGKKLAYGAPLKDLEVTP